jgi:hypothetical protein
VGQKIEQAWKTFEMCEMGFAKLKKIFENERDDFSNSKKIHSWKRAGRRDVRIASKADLLSHRRNSSGSFATLAAIRRTSS